MTTSITLSRRALLRATLLASAFAPVAAFAQGTTTGAFRAVSVDVSTLIDHGGGAAARALAEVLQGQMLKVFADRIVGGKTAPLLTARITNLFFASFSGNESPMGFGNNDNIEGEGIVSAGGTVLSSTHVLTELSPSYSGAYYTQGVDRIRLEAIAYQFAYWLRREMNL